MLYVGIKRSSELGLGQPSTFLGEVSAISSERGGFTLGGHCPDSLFSLSISFLSHMIIMDSHEG